MSHLDLSQESPRLGSITTPKNSDDESEDTTTTLLEGCDLDSFYKKENEKENKSENYEKKKQNHDPNIDLVSKAITQGDIPFLSENKDMIKALFEKNESNSSQCWCGCPESYSLFTKLTNPPAHSHFSSNDKSLEELQVLYFRSINYLVDNALIDPDRIFSYNDRVNELKRECILSELISNYAGWAYQRKMILYYMKKMSREVLRDFRNQNNCTMLQVFLMCHCYDDDDEIDVPISSEMSEYTQFCIEVRDYLVSCGIDLMNVGQIYNATQNPENDYPPFSTLFNAIDVLSPYLVKLCLSSNDKNQANMITTNEPDDCLENMAMHMLFRRRYTHNPKIIDDIAQILSMLIKAGLDLNYLTADKRNISDYCKQNGFSNTSVGELLVKEGAPAPTGNLYAGEGLQRSKRYKEYKKKMSGRETGDDYVDIYENHEVVKLLYEYRYVKDQSQLAILYERFKELSADDLFLNEKKKTASCDLYNHYVNCYGWEYTPIGKHVDYLSKLMKDSR